MWFLRNKRISIGGSASNHITRHDRQRKTGKRPCGLEAHKWLRFFVSSIAAIFRAAPKITDAHFARVKESIQPGLESISQPRVLHGEKKSSIKRLDTLIKFFFSGGAEQFEIVEV